MNSFATKHHSKVHPIEAYYLLNQNMIRLKFSYSCFKSSYLSSKFKKIEFALYEIAYLDIPCEINQTLPPSTLDFAENFSICLSTILRHKCKILLRYFKIWPRYALWKWGGVGENVCPISRHVMKGHIQHEITQEVEQIEAWGFHCCIQKFTGNLMSLL